MNPLSKNILAGMLIMSAIVLTILLVAEPTPKAQGLMMSQQGDIVLITTSAVGQDDLLSVIDVRNGKMVTYGYNTVSHRIQPIAGLSLFR